jgi:hypothetical protein
MTTTVTKLSKKTLGLLKNFSGINSNLYVKPGNKIQTVSPAKNVFAECTVEETFDVPFGIWDLNKFLGVVSLFDDADFTFDTKHVTISSETGSTVKYYYSDPKLLSYPTKNIKKIDSAISFELSSDDLQELRRAGSVLQLSDLCFMSEGDKIFAVVKEIKDPTCNTYSIEVGDNTSQADFSFNLKLENIKILDGDYRVDLSKSVISQFTHQSMPLSYWIAMESNSTYTE